MRRSVESDGVKVSDMADLMRPLSTSVLAGHDIAAQIDGDGVFAIHPTFLTQRLDRPAAYNGFVKFVDALPEAKGVWILDQGLEDRPGQAVQLCRLEPSRPNSSRSVIDIHHAFKAHGYVGANLVGEPSLQRLQIMMVSRQHHVERRLARTLCQLRFDPAALLGVIQRIGATQMLPGPIARYRHRCRIAR